MPLVIRVLLALFLLGLPNVAHAQTTGSLHTGFAIITVQSGNSAGLAPVETLTFTASGLTTHTDVSPAALLTNSALVVNLSTIIGGSTGIAIVNPSTATANVQLAINDPAGAQILSRIVSILPRGQLSRFLNELFPGQITTTTAQTGLLTITSDVPVGILALTFRDAGVAGLPLTSLSSPFPLPATTFTPATNIVVTGTTASNMITTTGMVPIVTVNPAAFGTGTSPVTVSSITTTPAAQATSTIGGGASFLFPQIATGGGWSSLITVANNSTNTQIIRIDFFDSNGNDVETVNGAIVPAHGLFNLLR
jgi:hypothetical protein